MQIRMRIWGLLAVLGLCFWLASSQQGVEAGGKSGKAVPPPTVTASAIGGIVASAKGPEAGVWVIAETKDLPTGFRKIVVTDDQGRYVVPDLPKGNYKVWVRGYGLIDSKPVESAPGKTVNLQAVIAPSPLAAAQYYPADYWYSLIQVPPKSAFPMEKEGIENQLQWISNMKGAIQLIQVGDKATREIPEALGKFSSSREAWEAWLKTEPPVTLGRLNHDVALKMYSDWTDRIAAGEVPPAPPRPQGVERNVVISEWDWGNDKSFVHDVTVTNQVKPTVNANGPVFGLEQFSSDKVVYLDPVASKWADAEAVVRDQDMKPNFANRKSAPLEFGDEDVRPAKMRLHNSVLDEEGKLWLTGKFRNANHQPDFCKAGSSLPSAKFYPLESNGNGVNALQVEIFDPETRKFAMIDTCYSTMHLVFTEDKGNTLWFSGGNNLVGWFNTKVYKETNDVAKAQGWCPYVLDTNGNGKLDAFVGPDDPVDATKDKQIKYNSYGIGANPADGTLWLGQDTYPGAILRVDPGSNPPYTCITEKYNSPAGTSNPKGVSVDRNGLVWVGFAGSGTFGSFDRRKCKITSGPKATGDQCPEGWTLYPSPGPKFKGVEDAINTDWHYLNWVDQYNTLGLGKNVPMAPGTNSDSTIALLPDSKKFVVMRVPYPLGFYSRGMEGRIDNPNAGWKGRGLWTTYASISPWNVEGGKGQVPKVVKLQVRPDPLTN